MYTPTHTYPHIHYSTHIVPFMPIALALSNSKTKHTTLYQCMFNKQPNGFNTACSYIWTFQIHSNNLPTLRLQLTVTVTHTISHMIYTIVAAMITFIIVCQHKLDKHTLKYFPFQWFNHQCNWFHTKSVHSTAYKINTVYISWFSFLLAYYSTTSVTELYH